MMKLIRRNGKALCGKSFDVTNMRKMMIERGRPKMIQSQRRVWVTTLDHFWRRKCPIPRGIHRIAMA
jgi:hypothetical protein